MRTKYNCKHAVLALWTLASASLIAGCDLNWPQDPNLPVPVPVPVSRVAYFRATPLPLVAGDTVLLKVGIEDSLNVRIRYLWSNAQEAPILPVNGRLDGPSVRIIVPQRLTLRVNVTVHIPDDKNTSSVRHHFEYPVITG